MRMLRGLKAYECMEKWFVWSKKTVVRGKMQDAEDETKDYSVKETKGEQSGVDEVRGEQRRSVSFIAHSRSIARRLNKPRIAG